MPHSEVWADNTTVRWFVKLWLGALIPRSVCLSVCLLVLQKLQKKLQNLTKPCKMLQNNEMRSFVPLPPFLEVKTVKEASAVCRSFLDGVVIFLVISQPFHIGF